MLQNAYLDAKIGVDSAENEPSEVVILRSDTGVSILRAPRRRLRHCLRGKVRFDVCSALRRAYGAPTDHTLLALDPSCMGA